MKKLYIIGKQTFLLFLIASQIAIAQKATTSVGVGNTPAELSVSLTGGAAYTVPFALPPGIKDLMPKIGLSYNSQGGNGLAGWGWNILGLSTITRIPSTKFHDGVIDGVDGDRYDRFALDGQRLVLTDGKYGWDASSYITENRSNIKVVLYGGYGSETNPYFDVYYPDGSYARYGDENSRSVVEWAIRKWQDAQGNYILYDYEKDEELLRISKISYGAKGKALSPNTIIFYYKKRSRLESTFMDKYSPLSIYSKPWGKYHSLVRSSLLERVEIKGKGSVLYRKYQLYHDQTTLGYDRVRAIQEYNAAGEAMPAIQFSYDNTVDGIKYYGATDIDYSFDFEKDVISSGDFNGDGHMDFIKFNREGRNKIEVFDFKPEEGRFGHTTIYIDDFMDAFPSTTLGDLGIGRSSPGKLLENQNITVIENSNDKGIAIKNFDYFDYDGSRLGTIGKSAFIAGIENIGNVSAKTFVPGDFNGDGITDVLAIDLPYGNNNSNSIRFIDLSPINNTDWLSLGSLVTSIGKNDKLLSGDFNGNGKADLFHFAEQNVYIYELNEKGWLKLIHKEYDNSISFTKRPVLLGDFNGDGKTDFTVPKPRWADGGDEWRFFYSTGSSIHALTKDVVYYSHRYYLGDGHNGHKNEYIAQDINGDGKTDILYQETYRRYISGHAIIHVLSNVADEDGYASFEETATYTSTAIKKFGRPIFFNIDKRNEHLEYGYIADDKIHAFQFSKDNRKEVVLFEISNNGIVQRIDYAKVEEGNDVYASDREEDYPYVNINNAPSFKVVSKITETAEGITRYQDFLYKGAVSHAKGLGFLGFKWMARSNTYGKDVGKLWTVSHHNPQKRGAVIEEWTSASSSFTPSSFIEKTDFTYQTSLAANKVFTNVPTKVVTDNRLQGVSTTKGFEYDGYYNITKSTTSVPGGSNIVEARYSNNPSVGSSYYIGRPTYKKETSVLGGERFSTETQYAYSGSLLSSKKSKAMGSNWLTENYRYDGYGNMTRRTLSGTGIASRSESFKYSSDGRFLIESTDIEGMKTTFSYDEATGNVLSSTDSYGLTVSSKYDKWNRLIAESDYLNNIIKYSYKRYDEYGVKTEVHAPDGSKTREYTNAFGWVTKSEALSINDKWIAKEFEYDITGKTLRASEPFFDSPTQWNQTSYDKYGRLISKQLYTGKVITTEYNGLSVTVDDGTKTVTTTKDAAGNTIKLKDLGGTINYTYFANGVMKSANYGDNVVTTKIDEWGRKKELNDPSAGKYTYEYNMLGETIKETTPKGYTQYTYDSFGKVTSKKVSGDETELSLNYTYDEDTKLLMSMSGVDAINNNNYAYTYTYDSYKRPQSVSENMGAAKFSKRWTYDNLGRQQTEEIGSQILNGMSSTVQTGYVYGSSGALREVQSGNKTLWKLETSDHKEQPTLISLGNGQKKHLTYDEYGTIQHILHNKSNGATALDIAYDFNPQRGILNKRERQGITQNPYKEQFSYDKLDRLTTISGAVNKTQSYEADGRITENSSLGIYNYDPAKRYRLATMDLNEQGLTYYGKHSKQEITYNAFKKPIEVYEKGHGRVSFQYGPLMGRSHAYYGGEQEDKLERRYRKYYSSIVPVEIVQDRETGKDKTITYVHGGPYDAPVVHIKETGDKGEFDYLHRDYLGSILAITNSSAKVVEQRQFGAWGVIDYFSKGLQASEFNWENTLLARGYTGHEHFFGVALIHMNGRMYDANLGRFLSPDNNIQEPFNTQNFNRYGYALNNPLMYTDQDGEIFFLVAALIGAVVSVVTNGISNTIQGKPFFKGAGTAALFGAIGGIASFGIGAAASSISGSLAASGIKGFANTLITGAFQAGAHALLGGTMSVMQGDKFGAGALAGFAGSVIGSATGGIFGKSSNFVQVATTIAAGGIAGGVGSVIGGGKFWDGFRNGVIAAGLNHALHKLQQVKTKATDPKEKKPDGKTIIYERDTETKKSTTGKFWIEGTDIEGYMLEPAGPDEIKSNQNKRIPEGTYNLEPFSGATKKNVLRLYNGQVPRDRYILIHAGNTPANTRGCLLPGPTTSTDYVGGTSGSSGRMVKQIVNHYEKVKELKIIIRNPIVTTNQPLKK